MASDSHRARRQTYRCEKSILPNPRGGCANVFWPASDLGHLVNAAISHRIGASSNHFLTGLTEPSPDCALIRPPAGQSALAPVVRGKGATNSQASWQVRTGIFRLHLAAPEVALLLDSQLPALLSRRPEGTALNQPCGEQSATLDEWKERTQNPQGATLTPSRHPVAPRLQR